MPDTCTVTEDQREFASALERAAENPGPLADGSLFFQRQQAELDTRVRHGLASLELARRGAAA